MVITRDVTPAGRRDVVLVTGPAGAGRSTAINALEDLGFEAIDNLPISFLMRLLSGADLTRPLAVGIDPRTRDFAPDRLLRAAAELRRNSGYNTQLLFIDCRADVLLNRFNETRRRHPTAPDETPTVGIERELALLSGVREAADILIDTSELTPHDLRRSLGQWFGGKAGGDLVISVQSFSYKRGTPRDLDMILDMRFLKNPHWEPHLRPLNGRDRAIGDYVSGDPLWPAFLNHLIEFTKTLLPAYKAEGKSYFSIGLGCTGGKHRSVFVAEHLSKTLAAAGWLVSTRHRELERVGALGAPPGRVGES